MTRPSLFTAIYLKNLFRGVYTYMLLQWSDSAKVVVCLAIVVAGCRSKLASRNVAASIRRRRTGILPV